MNQRPRTPCIAPVAIRASGVDSIPLSPGACIQGGFWAHRQAQNADVSLVEAWPWLELSGALPNFRAVAAGGVGHRGEANQDAEVYKWVEAASYEVARTGSQDLRSLLDEAVQAIAGAQREDGYLHTWYLLTPGTVRFSGLRTGGPDETYTAGHLLSAAVAHHRATGEHTLLNTARMLALCLDTELFTPQPTAVTGHPGLEAALVELYRETGDVHDLRLAKHLIDARGHGQLGTHRFGSSHYQDDVPVRDALALTGHAVAGLYLMTGATDVAVEAKDTELLAASERLWDSVAQERSFITAGIGSRPKNEDLGNEYELSPDSAYCETCAAVGMVMWSWRLLLATGRSKYADMIERVLFNSLLVGVSLDGMTFRYDNPLQVRGGLHTRAEERALSRTPWFDLACCPPNLMRLVASLGHYAASMGSDDSLRIHQYFDGVIPWSDAAEVEVRTSYPWAGRVVLTYRGAQMVGAVEVRVPAWSRNTRVEVAGQPVDGVSRGTYLRLDRHWQNGDSIVVDLDIEPRLVRAHPRVDAVRGCVVIERGPLVYCIEQVDNPAPIDDLRVGSGLTGLTQHHDDNLGVTTLTFDTRRVDLAGWTNVLYSDVRDLATAATESAIATAIPYFAWGNRGTGPMRVWIPVEGDA